MIFHFGVLYHLLKPVEHLAALGRISDTIFLDTHYCKDDEVTGKATIGDVTYQYREVDEGGWQNPFSGKDPTAIHLTMGSLEQALTAAGYRSQTVLQQRDEQNGPRALIWARG